MRRWRGRQSRRFYRNLCSTFATKTGSVLERCPAISTKSCHENILLKCVSDSQNPRPKGRRPQTCQLCTVIQQDAIARCSTSENEIQNTEKEPHRSAEFESKLLASTMKPGENLLPDTEPTLTAETTSGQQPADALHFVQNNR